MLKDCDVCGKAFTSKRADARYCSATCRQIAHRRVTDNGAPGTRVTDNNQAVTDKPLDAATDVLDPAGAVAPAAAVINETEKAKQAGPPISAPDPASAEQVEIAPQAIEIETVETTAGETAPETMQLPPDAPTRDNLVMAALDRLAGHAPERRQQAIEDAQKYQAKWGEGPHRADWTATQEARLIWQLCGREVSALTGAQAVVGNKVIYRNSLGM